jgi:hypothetical protein
VTKRRRAEDEKKKVKRIQSNKRVRGRRLECRKRIRN